MSTPAAFLDRDDTLVVDSGFIDHPDKVSLMPGAIEAVRRLKDAGFKVIVATNQSGVARGYFDENRLKQIHDRLQSLLRAGGTELDRIYYCPFLDGPDAKVDTYRRDSDLRKPKPGMLLQAARDLDIDLERSWMIGDSARDIQAGQAAGCSTILINRNGQSEDAQSAKPSFSSKSLIDAVAIIEEDSASDQTASTASRSNDVLSSERLLRDIRDLLDRQQRARWHREFSVRQLVATIVQMIALVVAAWAFMALVGGQIETAQPKLLVAAFLQLVVITLIISSRTD